MRQMLIDIQEADGKIKGVKRTPRKKVK